ncbi:MAG: hypothetical protein O3A66_01005 [Proteobacteria bacterium]|jgi:hypothetical protein|nr:hypothetical protein [Pseudomonadota bacterium]
MLLLVATLLLFTTSFAETFNTGYVPVNVQGYIVQTDTRLAPDIIEQEISNARSGNSRLEANLRRIQEQYPDASSPYNDAIIPTDETQVSNRIKGYNKVVGVHPNPVEITTNAMKQLCNDMGFNEETQRSTLEFYSCVSQAMKTKFTEETLRKTKYNNIDANIIKALQSNTSVDSFVESLVQYQELLSQRNKMDCLREDDYHKCSKAVTEYKLCHNKVVDETKIEHNANKVICYVKTGIRFPNPSIKEATTRDAYYGMCVHLVEKDLRKKLFENNGECNQILTKNNLMHLTV